MQPVRYFVQTKKLQINKMNIKTNNSYAAYVDIPTFLITNNLVGTLSLKI